MQVAMLDEIRTMYAYIASTWASQHFKLLQLLRAVKIKPATVRIKRLCVSASGLTAGVVICYIALRLLGFIVLGHLCEYAVLRKHIDVCGTDTGTTGIDVYSSAVANFSKVLVHHDAYDNLSRLFANTRLGTNVLSCALQSPGRERDYIETTRGLVEEYESQLIKAEEAVYNFGYSLYQGEYRIQSANDMLVDYYLHDVSGKMAHVWHILGYSHDSALDELEAEFLDCVNSTLQVFEHMQGKAENAEPELDHLGFLLGRLSDSAQYGFGVLQDDVEKRTWEGYVYAHVPCGWTNLCGLIGRPSPMRLAHNVGRSLHMLNETWQYSNRAGAALGSIRAVHDAHVGIIGKAKHALGVLLIEASKAGESHRKGHEKALVMEWKRGRRRLRKSLSDMSAIRASFKNVYRVAKPLKQPPPSFEFPALDIPN